MTRRHEMSVWIGACSFTAELQRTATVGAATLTYTASNLAANTYYFAITAAGTNGLESAYSDIASKTIP